MAEKQEIIKEEFKKEFLDKLKKLRMLAHCVPGMCQPGQPGHFFPRRPLEELEEEVAEKEIEEAGKKVFGEPEEKSE